MLTNTRSVPELLSVEDAARELAVSTPTIWRHVRSGKLRAVRVGGCVRIPRDALVRFTVPYETRPR